MTDAQPLGKLEPVDPREIWQHEAHDFTPWLAKNLDLLGEELGFDLELEDTETTVGDFFADITATELGRKAKVIVENQLATTDHNHLGQLMTYASGQDADIVIWVTTEFRDAHRQALDWLNQRTDDSLEFYGVTINVKRIGGSHPAPEFRAVAFPNSWQKATKTREQGVSPREERYHVFFQTLIDELRTRHKFTNAKKAGEKENWYGFRTGHSKISYQAALHKNSKAWVGVYLEREKGDNKRLFDTLEERRSEIEEAFGGSLEWERRDDVKLSKIGLYTEGSIDDSKQELTKLREWMVENLLKFKKVFSPHLGDLV